MTESYEYVKEYCENTQNYIKIMSEHKFCLGERKVPSMCAIDQHVQYIKKLTPEQQYQLLTPENKSAVIRQIELLVTSQSSDQ